MNHVGIAQSVQIGTHTVRLGRLTRAVMRRWLEWARKKLRPFLDAILKHFDRFPPCCQRIMAEEAMTLAESLADFNSPDLSDLWFSDEGQIQLLALLMDCEPALALDLASQAVSDGLPVGIWVGKATGRTSLTPTELEAQAYRQAGLLPQSSPSRPTPINWASVDKDIFQNIGLTPEQVDLMTLAELCTVLRAETEMTQGEKEEHAKLYHKLTPKQKLNLALLTADN